MYDYKREDTRGSLIATEWLRDVSKSWLYGVGGLKSNVRDMMAVIQSGNGLTVKLLDGKNDNL